MRYPVFTCCGVFIFLTISSLAAQGIFPLYPGQPGLKAVAGKPGEYTHGYRIVPDNVVTATLAPPDLVNKLHLYFYNNKREIKRVVVDVVNGGKRIDVVGGDADIGKGGREQKRVI